MHPVLLMAVSGEGVAVDVNIFIRFYTSSHGDREQSSAKTMANLASCLIDLSNYILQNSLFEKYIAKINQYFFFYIYYMHLPKRGCVFNDICSYICMNCLGNNS